MKANLKLTAVFEEAEEGRYVAFFEELPEPKPVSTTPIAFLPQSAARELKNLFNS